jgi:hypothetical protein
MGFSQLFSCNYDFFVAFLNSLEEGLFDIFENEHEILVFLYSTYMTYFKKKQCHFWSRVR